MNNKKFSKFIKKCALEIIECQGLDLASFLLEPVQRIARYPLLLRHILHYTNKTDEDQIGILQALQESEKLLNIINDSVRRHEDQRKINNLALMLRQPLSYSSSSILSSSSSSLSHSHSHSSLSHIIIVGKTKWGIDRRILCDANIGKKKRAFLLNDMFLLVKKDGPRHYKFIHPPIPILQLTNEILNGLEFENQYIKDIWISEMERAKLFHQSTQSIHSNIVGDINDPHQSSISISHNSPSIHPSPSLILSIIGTIQVSIQSIVNAISSSSSSKEMYQCILKCGMGITSSTSVISSCSSFNLQFDKDILVLGLASFDDILRMELVKYHPFSPNGIY